MVYFKKIGEKLILMDSARSCWVQSETKYAYRVVNIKFYWITRHFARNLQFLKFM